MISKCRNAKLLLHSSKVYNKRGNDHTLSLRKIIQKNSNICFFQICRNTFSSTNSSSYDIFDKIKDSNDKQDGVENESSKKRKPSKKVLKLVDDILNLTLIEAADLCDLCQEKLEGNKSFNNGYFINRNPFPHPSSFFGASNMSQINGGLNMAPPNITNTSANVESESPDIKQTNESTKSDEKKKSAKNTFSIKLEKFDVKNKINTIKEIRKITNVGLKEAKEMVESAPFYIQKNVPAEQADEIKKTFEGLGATIILE
ncbi:mitochondrial ribosomal protein L12 precursor, putative [Plasmodium vinckei lentum]|uniref:Mitochondrial ribosomal protein L12, putative n=1 Tax=Plasmodium vinckei lentum TaxID=138297 RepID=A0A6V7RW60_PLAVN|nr:mitochondrial ribosomal protein L12 precursor, putative [Plasmodium vinckei lentum]